MEHPTSQAPVDGDVLEFIRSRLPGFSPAERRVAEAVLETPGNVLHMSAARLAKASGSSVGSVVRFCHALGLPGYQDFKIRLAQRSAPAWSPSTRSVDRASSNPAQKVFADIADALVDTAHAMDVAMLDRVADLLINAQRILIVATGTSSPIAADMAYRLTSIGLPVSYPVEVDTQQAAAHSLGCKDVCLAISHSGRTPSTIDSIRIAITNQTPTVALTSFANSRLSGIAEAVLVAGSRPAGVRSEEMASRLVHLAVLNALCVLIVRRSGRDRIGSSKDCQRVSLQCRHDMGPAGAVVDEREVGDQAGRDPAPVPQPGNGGRAGGDQGDRLGQGREASADKGGDATE
ncbi:DNA-binding MurR/RpiR family transcriptional regulator [Actinopolymorpha pittospori]|uniref:DNA-binding MurR/RpiR family transcriptional regulator n=1 Tax=Actinopolymorpha pittospori TaxID=648752 RepID=A0A927RED9_9ACTN|nr:DNA-binding MurR/RpiR family transcriptional regulator [Actinopolymorpha pittospori]